MSARALALFIVGTSSLGCLSLGPMPSTLGASAVPAGRPDVSLQAGVVPGFKLSEGTQQSGGGSAIPQALVVVEPDRWIGVPGVLVGARAVNVTKADSTVEPLIGYRAHVGAERRFAWSALASFAKSSHAAEGASYSATRGAAELVFDARVVEQNRYAELHLVAGASVSALSADGTYCVDAARRYGVDCSRDVATPSPTVRGHVAGVFPTLLGGLAVDFAHHLPLFFHGGRLALHVAHGRMPTAIGGIEGDGRGYTVGGATLTLGFGGP